MLLFYYLNVTLVEKWLFQKLFIQQKKKTNYEIISVYLNFNHKQTKQLDFNTKMINGLFKTFQNSNAFFVEML